MACVVYGQFDSKIRFENESDGRFDSRFDSNEKKAIRRSIFETVENISVSTMNFGEFKAT